MPHVWVVELLGGGKWEPTADHGLTRWEAQIELDFLRNVHPTSRYRLRKYVAIPERAPMEERRG